MADEHTGPHSIEFRHTGAAAHGNAQTDPDASLGNYLASTIVHPMSWTVDTSLTTGDITVDTIDGENATGAGTITATGASALAWTAPGGSQGDPVTIANGETKVLQDGTNANAFIVVSRTSATALTGTSTITISENAANAYGFDTVSAAEASAGDSEYRCLGLIVLNPDGVVNLKVWINTLGTQAVSDGGQLGAAGAGTIVTTGDLDANGWPEQGFAHIKDSGGTTREIVYYSGRTSTTLTVPAAGRGALGSSAAAGAATDTIDAVPGIRIAKEAPSSQPSGNFTDKTGAGEGSDPGLSWNDGITEAEAESIGTLTVNQIYAVWIEREVIAGTTGMPDWLNALKYYFEAA